MQMSFGCPGFRFQRKFVENVNITKIMYRKFEALLLDAALNARFWNN